MIGGADLDPASYGQAVTARTEATSPLRDEFELTLVRAAFARATVHCPAASASRPCTRSRPSRAEPGPPPAAPVPERVNSHHHQGIDRVGEGGRVVVRSVPDQLVEAVQWSAMRYALGVQWHPEALHLDATIAGLVTAALTSRHAPPLAASAPRSARVPRPRSGRATP